MTVSFWFYLCGFIFVTLSQLLCNTESACRIFVALSLWFYLCDFILAALYAGSLWLKFLPCSVYGARCTSGIFKQRFEVTRPNSPGVYTNQKTAKKGKVYKSCLLDPSVSYSDSVLEPLLFHQLFISFQNSLSSMIYTIFSLLMMILDFCGC